MHYGVVPRPPGGLRRCRLFILLAVRRRTKAFLLYPGAGRNRSLAMIPVYQPCVIGRYRGAHLRILIPGAPRRRSKQPGATGGFGFGRIGHW